MTTKLVQSKLFPHVKPPQAIKMNPGEELPSDSKFDVIELNQEDFFAFLTRITQ
jgi:hypothetical protein